MRNIVCIEYRVQKILTNHTEHLNPYQICLSFFQRVQTPTPTRYAMTTDEEISAPTLIRSVSLHVVYAQRGQVK